MRLKITLVIVVLAMSFSNAQMRKWTLQECVEYAVENNLSIEQFELDLENAKIDKSDALGAFLPSLNGDSRLTASTGLSFNPTTQEPVNTTILNFTGNLTSAITLFDGLRNVHQFNRAKLNAIANQYRLDDLKDDIRLNVANAYLQVLSNKEQLKTFEAQYAVTEQDLKRTRELVESGVLPRGDLLEIEATAANQEQQIINGEGLVLISRVSLAQLLQITDYENFDIADEEFGIPPSDILKNSAKVIFDKALTFRNDIRFSETSVELAEKDLQIAKGANYPTVGAFFNYNTRYSDQNFGPDGSLIPFTEQLYVFDGISYGASLNVPIFNGWSTRNSVRRSKINLEQAKLQLEQDKLALETNIQQAYVDVTTFFKAYEAALKTMDARRLAYDYAKERYDVGLMNAFDFSQAQARVDNAEADVIRTKYDYIFRLKILEFYFGIPIALN
ncbi:TolC family protein [Flagellimonas allohymeniacidonis]|uniref:TolC family protein n=1 Tax=Flagellimonas allohymeniacidonis TaxID=2517819 RepID=A0A4V2HSA6_9FLAO|nr:TolC family protein [Allomuricauda hymeniacidonis]TAI47020.1 TolC family protein [Allomuricauda hymeniacidonis]